MDSNKRTEEHCKVGTCVRRRWLLSLNAITKYLDFSNAVGRHSFFSEVTEGTLVKKISFGFTLRNKGYESTLEKSRYLGNTGASVFGMICRLSHKSCMEGRVIIGVGIK